MLFFQVQAMNRLALLCIGLAIVLSEAKAGGFPLLFAKHDRAISGVQMVPRGIVDIVPKFTIEWTHRPSWLTGREIEVGFRSDGVMVWREWHKK
jgi:hypothetical protein